VGSTLYSIKIWKHFLKTYDRRKKINIEEQQNNSAVERRKADIPEKCCK
jgi:hypothetical protein